MLPAELAGRVFTRREALDAGMSDRSLGRAHALGAVTHLGYGAWADAAVGDLAEAAIRAVVLRAPYAVVSHSTAARAWGADPSDRRVHVTVPREAPLRSREGLVVHRDRLDRSEVLLRQGFATTDPYRTAIDVARASGRHLEPSVVLVDALLAAEHVDRPPLLARLASMPTGRGMARARTVLGLARYGAQSPGETRLRLALTARGVPDPRLQYRIRCRGGLVVADLCWPEQRLVVEYDGFGPHTERATFERDRRRWSWLRADGWELRAYTAESLRERRAAVAAEVLSLLARPATQAA